MPQICYLVLRGGLIQPLMRDYFQFIQNLRRFTLAEQAVRIKMLTFNSNFYCVTRLFFNSMNMYILSVENNKLCSFSQLFSNIKLTLQTLVRFKENSIISFRKLAVIFETAAISVIFKVKTDL